MTTNNIDNLRISYINNLGFIITRNSYNKVIYNIFRLFNTEVLKCDNQGKLKIKFKNNRYYVCVCILSDETHKCYNKDITNIVNYILSIDNSYEWKFPEYMRRHIQTVIKLKYKIVYIIDDNYSNNVIELVNETLFLRNYDDDIPF